MKSHIILLLLALISLPMTSSAQGGGCIDPAQIDPEAVCLLIYDPVCGCDGVTYDNDCFAFYSGVTSWTAGECGQSSVPPCTDMADVDFGQCDMAMGVAVVNGECASLSGCGWTVGGTDYSGAFFSSFQECQTCLDVQTVEPCTDLTGIDFGPCLAFFGVGMFDGQCQMVGGCGPLVGNMDYSAAVYSTMEECLSACVDVQTVESCTDLAGVDFGMCAAYLGVGIIDNECVGISGCGTTVGNVDYSPAFYPTMQECLACIISVGETGPADDLTIFPNPGDGRVGVRTGILDGTMRITDLSGRTVLTVKVQDGRAGFDAGRLQRGTYLLTVEGGGKARSGRFTVR